MGVGPLPSALSFIWTSAGSGTGSCYPLLFGLRLYCGPCGGEVTQRSCDGQVELRPWRRDGHPQVGDSAETAAGGGPEPASGEGFLVVEFGLEARVLVRGWVLG